MSRGSIYPPSERVTASKLKVGDQLLIRDRRSDQPVGTATYDPETRETTFNPMATGVWTVEHLWAEMDYHGRRAKRVYSLVLTHPGGDKRTIETTPVQRFNRVVES